MKKEIEKIICGEYRIGEKVGCGATGEVYEVFHKKNGQKYALKISEKKKILRQEAEWMKKIQCKVFPQIFDYKEERFGYLIMEYVEGRNLQDMLDAGITFELSEAVWIMLAVLKGLEFLHKQTPSMVYRDLKPANIIIEKEGEVRLIDLGSVVAVRDGEHFDIIRAGTYGYAAPEQFWPEMVPKTDWDVYAAGKLLGYLLTGHNPAIPPYEVEEYYKNDKRIPGIMKEVLNRSLAKQGEARYADASFMRAHLQMAMEAIKTKKWQIPYRKQKFEYKKCIWLSEYRRIF